MDKGREDRWNGWRINSLDKYCSRRTVVKKSHELKHKYWATCSSVRSFACSGLLASLPPSTALTRSLARSLRSLPHSWESELLMSHNYLVLSHSAAEEEVAEAAEGVIVIGKEEEEAAGRG